MPTTEENLKLWTDHTWPLGGAEWTLGYGGPDLAWKSAVYPRLEAFVPAGHILEIGPGFGLWTAYLRNYARRLTLVDLTPRCIQACRKRFGRRRMRYHVNDGRSLAMIEDASIDLIFSWHSLVHADRATMHAYIAQFAAKLRPGGIALIQHSHLGSYRNPATGLLRIENRHGFGEDVSGATIAEDCRGSRLHLLEQEIVPWAGDELTSCFSLIRRPLAADLDPGPCEPFVNHEFWPHVRDRGRVQQHFRFPRGEFVIR